MANSRYGSGSGTGNNKGGDRGEILSCSFSSDIVYLMEGKKKKKS